MRKDMFWQNFTCVTKEVPNLRRMAKDKFDLVIKNINSHSLFHLQVQCNSLGSLLIQTPSLKILQNIVIIIFTLKFFG